MTAEEISTQQAELAFGLDAGVWEVMSTMRAIRRLKPDPVPRELLERLVQAATWAPSAGNAQAGTWVVVTDRAQIASLEPVWKRCLGLYWASAEKGGSQTISDGQLARLRKATEYQGEHFVEIPALLVACYKAQSPLRRSRGSWGDLMRALAKLGPRDAMATIRQARRAAAMAEAASVYPAVQNVLLSARALGLGATLTTLHLAAEREFKRVLRIPKDVKTFAVIPVGYPLGRFGPVRRRAVADILRWERF
jgi:nitroreductase